MKRFGILWKLPVLAAAAAALMAVSALAAGSGSCGSGVSWAVDSSGTLTISGSGAMADCASAAEAPWAEEDVRAVVVEEGVTHVGEHAFGGLILDSVTLPESLESIGDSAFDGTGVTQARFAGDLKQWEKEITIGGGNGSLTDVIVMDKDVTYQGKGFSLANGVVTCRVKALPEEFKAEYNDYVFEVVFQDVTTIASGACGSRDSSNILTNLKRVTIPDSVKSIAKFAFKGCSGLTGVYITDIAAWCDINFAGNPLSYAHKLYLDGELITDLVIPDGVAGISGMAFYGCSALTSVTIPDSVTRIGGSAFSGCGGLRGVYITDIAAWCDIGFADNNSNPLRCAHELYLDGERITDLVIPDGVAGIGNYVFSGCTGLTGVTIPDSVKSIGVGAFSNCTGLPGVTIGNSVAGIGDGAFSGCSALTGVTIPDSVQSIGSLAFHGCGELTSVTVPYGVQSIRNSVFSGCVSLESVTLPDGVASIGDSAFHGCGALTSVTIPDGVKSISACAFENCVSLESVTIPGSLTYVDQAAFHGCGGLRDVYYDGTASMWGEINIGSGNAELTNAAMHPAAACGTAGDCGWVLRETGLLKITGRGKMEDYALGEAPWLEYKDRITEILVNPGVKTIGEYAFADMGGVTAVTGMEGVTSIGGGAFMNCSSLGGLTIPSAVTAVGKDAFRGCGSLTTVTVPGDVTDIGEDAFASCANLTDVYFGGEQEAWDAANQAGDAGYGGAKIHILVRHARVEAACGEDGNVEYWSCTACEDLMTGADHHGTKVTPADTVIPALGHDWGEWKVETEPNCTYEGMEIRICGRDGSHTQTRIVEPNGVHVPGEAVEENVVPATPAAEGRYDEVVYCSVCHEELSRTAKTIDKNSGRVIFTREDRESRARGVEEVELCFALDALSKEAAEGQDTVVSMEIKTVPDLTQQPDSALAPEQAERKAGQRNIISLAAEGMEPDFLEISLSKYVDGELSGTLAECPKVLEIPIIYDLTGAADTIVFRDCGGQAAVLRRLTERPSEYQDLEGSYYVSGSGTGAVIYIYAAKFSTYAVATYDEPVYSAALEGNTVRVTLDGYTGGILMAVCCSPDGRMLDAVLKATDGESLRYELTFDDLSEAGTVKLFCVGDAGWRPLRDVTVLK